MRSEGKQGYAAQIVAWLGVVAVHVGYFRDTEGNILGLWTTASDAA